MGLVPGLGTKVRSQDWVMDEPSDSVQRLGWVRSLRPKFGSKHLVTKTDLKLEPQRLLPCYLLQLPSPDEELVFTRFSY